MKKFGGMTAARLQEIIDRFPKLRIAVIGDFFLDKYLDVDPALAEVSLETGKTAHQVAAIRHSPGAAGTVMSNLSALGAGTLYAVGYTGDDGESYDLRNDLTGLRCSTEHLYCDRRRSTPTYLKPRDQGNLSLEGEHNRYDTKNRSPTPDDLQKQLIESVDRLLPQLDALIVMDQVEEEECGAITTAVAAALAQRAERYPKVVFWADSRRRICQFRRMIIKPNQFEAVGMTNAPPDAKVDLADLEQAVERLRSVNAAPVCATRGPEGMLVSDPELTLVPGVRVEGPIDPTGAGDSVTASAVLTLAAGATLPEAALIGNLVASITVQQLATTGVARPDQLPPRLLELTNQQGW
jgi:rfaE bifunctional protein kinase chain/domain